MNWVLLFTSTPLPTMNRIAQYYYHIHSYTDLLQSSSPNPCRNSRACQSPLSPPPTRLTESGYPKKPTHFDSILNGGVCPSRMKTAMDGFVSSPLVLAQTCSATYHTGLRPHGHPQSLPLKVAGDHPPVFDLFRVLSFHASVICYVCYCIVSFLWCSSLCHSLLFPLS